MRLDGVAQLVFKDASRQPAFIMKLGKAMEISKYKLAIHFPPSAPPTYEQSGYVRLRRLNVWGTAC